MSINSYLYDEVLSKIGYFKPKSKFKRMVKDLPYNPIVHINQECTVNEHTKIFYFPGCFAEFHDGHIDVIVRATYADRMYGGNYLFIIAPSNTDYTVEKYGDVINASNKYRYDRIIECIKNDTVLSRGNVAIDLDPMLNMECDYNFTDLLHNCMQNLGLDIKTQLSTPVIIAGKDREYFKNLNDLQNVIHVDYFPDRTNTSSSKLMTANPKPRVKKKCILRYTREDELDLFKMYFEGQYSEIIGLSLNEELNMVKCLLKGKQYDVTICKEYHELLPYVQCSRKFDNPLADPTDLVVPSDFNFNGLSVLDSDAFTGFTGYAIEDRGGKYWPVLNLIGTQDQEIVDFADFYKDEYQYPYVDVAERCSMAPFTYGYHKIYHEFRQNAWRLKNV